MKRAPIVLAGTAVGLAGVLSYTTSSPSPSAAAGSSSTVAVTQAATSAASRTATSSAASSTSTSPETTTTTTTTTRKRTAAATRTATGEAVSYQYGTLQVKVTKRGSRITKVSVVRLEVPEAHSQSIDQFAVPQLTQEAIAAQSAKIDTVSGASFTSAAYEQSLQSALDKL